MILSGIEIKRQLQKNIFIEPWDDRLLNSNSYNLRLHHQMLCYKNFPLDMKKPNEAEPLEIPETGLLLEPNKLYLGRTIEWTKTINYVPMLEGRSSIGRLGMFIHITAGFGDVGFEGFWTLEISVIHPLIIYAGVPISQIFYHTIDGEISPYHSDKYQKNTGIQPSMLYKDFEKSS